MSEGDDDGEDCAKDVVYARQCIEIIGVVRINDQIIDLLGKQNVLR